MTRWWVAGVVAAALWAPASVKAEPVAAAALKSTEAARKLRSLQEATGRVRTVDRDRNELTIAEGAEASPVILLVDKATTIFVDGRIGSLQDVREGFVVRASYDIKQGQNRAQWVEISKREPERQAPVTHGRKK